VRILGSTPWGTPFILPIPPPKKTNLSNQCHFEGRAPMILVFFFLALYCPSFYQIWYCFSIRTFVALFLATIVFVWWIFLLANFYFLIFF
jgi:hypothetical protein